MMHDGVPIHQDVQFLIRSKNGVLNVAAFNTLCTNLEKQYYSAILRHHIQKLNMARFLATLYMAQPFHFLYRSE